MSPLAHVLRIHGAGHCANFPRTSHCETSASSCLALCVQAGRVMHAPACGAFYASLLVASVTEIIWISHPWINHWHCCRLYYPQSRLFFAVETYLTLGLVAETSLALCWQRRAFWSSSSNWFDAIVCVASIASFGLYYYGGHTGLLDEALLLVVVGWLALRIARLAASIRKLLRERSRRSMASALDVAFPEDGASDDTSEDDSDAELGGGRRGGGGCYGGMGGRCYDGGVGSEHTGLEMSWCPTRGGDAEAAEAQHSKHLAAAAMAVVALPDPTSSRVSAEVPSSPAVAAATAGSGLLQAPAISL